MTKTHGIFFDLDDTLCDTHGTLLPEAMRRSFSEMKKAGLAIDFEKFLLFREQFMKESPKDCFFMAVAKNFSPDPEKVQIIFQTGDRAFYNYQVDTQLSLFEGALEMLDFLRNHYELHLVTAGHPQTQQQKVDILGLGETFKGIWYVDPRKGESKGDIFKKVIETGTSSASSYLSVGNRLDQEIRQAKELGARTCLVHYGEYFYLEPSDSLETPDYTVSHVKDLVSRCHL